MVNAEQQNQPINIQKARNSQIILLVLGVLWIVLGSYILMQQFASPKSITITWVTETEYDTAGFNIYRSKTPVDGFEQVNAQLIPSQADPASGASYEYVDSDVVAGETYYYKLEDVEYSNTRQQHDVISEQAPRVQIWALILAAVSFLLGLGLITTGIKGIRSL